MSKLFKLKQWLTISETAKYLSNVLSESVCETDVLRLGLDDKLDIYWYSHYAIRVSLSFNKETAKKINGSDTWESLLHHYIALPKDAIQVLMSGRDARLTFIDIDKNKILVDQKELVKAAMECLVLDQNITVLQTDKLFIKEIDALEFEKVLLQTKAPVTSNHLDTLNTEIESEENDAYSDEPPEIYDTEDKLGKFIESVIVEYPEATTKDIAHHCFADHNSNGRLIRKVKDLAKSLGAERDSTTTKRTPEKIKYMQDAPKFLIVN